ncbi:putative quinol monooxygenase [Paraburkholderia phenazinium]|jgi:quinol monooxygenase YgiN|uniref:Quinol monooxygenase YgiN n=1 Tax=Paraburkholderia phenazinium TaxID=60549 RepID=A0A1G8DZ30_9BURK|nr:putative quinol monooxygenase [Paraburkholderia phenazinium]SDH62893.1 Quinol monooxygenase YgiN [Paraburkholderia phenazinium]
MSEIVVISINVAKPGKENELADLLSSLIAPTAADAGMIRYDLHRDLADPRTFAFYEIWESRKALDDHLSTEHIARYRRLAPPLLERKELRIMEKTN